jgi:uncharacterized membrane protein
VAPFVWTLLIILMVIYTTAVFFTELVVVRRTDSFRDLPAAKEEELDLWYGSVGRSMLTLYEALVGGVDWDTVVTPLIDISVVLGIVFVLYIALSVLAFLNVITGVFVDTAMTRAHRMKDVATVNNACRIFDALDENHTGMITEEEFESQLYSDAMQEYLAEIDVDVSEAKWLFEILDINDTGSIDFDEFLSGCLRLRGPAKALDLLLVTRESRRMFQQILTERRKVERQLKGIRQTMGIVAKRSMAGAPKPSGSLVMEA